MENKIKLFGKKIRNPFPAIGKVFKYEMISGGRIILPVYAILLVLSFIVGVFVLDNDFDFDSDSSFGIVKVIIVMLTVILFIIMIVIIFSIISRRFKNSLLGDEAYLNFTLPVTVDEHLIGRYLADFVWILSYVIVTALAVLLIFIRGWTFIPEGISQFLTESASFSLRYGYSYIYIGWCFILNSLLYLMVICAFIYMVQTIIHMIGKHKTLFAVVLFAGVFFIYQNFIQIIFSGFDFNSLKEFEGQGFNLLNRMGLYNIVWFFAFSFTTRYCLLKKLNLN